jgi:AraC-like DNA-binding protein
MQLFTLTLDRPELKGRFYDHYDEELFTQAAELFDVQAACIPAPLRNHVDVLLVNRPRPEASGFTFSRAPECVVHIVINVYACTSSGEVESAELMVSGAHAAGHHPMPLDVRETIVAQLLPGAARAVLGVPASSVTGHFVRLEELWGSVAREAMERIAEERTSEGRMRVLCEVLCSRISNCENNTFGVRAAEALRSTALSPHRYNPADLFGYSERHVLRRFREDLGMSPKECIRTIRLASVLKDTRGGWAGNAALHGYFDQSHLIRDCRALLGNTPTGFLRSIAAPALMHVGIIARKKPSHQVS